MTLARPLARIAWALAAVTLFAVGGLLLIASPRWSVFSLVGDDAGYYFHLARNVCLGYGFSFDRQTATNGFNPLFPWLLVPTYRWLAGGLAIDTCYRLGVLLGWLAMLASFWAFVELVRGFLAGPEWPPGSRGALVACSAAFYVLFVGTKSYYGMDAPLVLLFGNLYLLRVMRGGLLAPGWRATLFDGALLALLFLARVDSLPLIVAAFSLMAWRVLRHRAGLFGMIGRGVVFLGLAAPYLISSHARFGTWMPISARIKSAFPNASLAQSIDAIRHSSLHLADQASFLVAGTVAAILCARWLVRRANGARADFGSGPEAVLAVLAVYLVLRFGFLLLFSRNDVQGSYVILAHVFNVLALLAAARVWLLTSRHSEPARERIATGLAAGLLLVGLGLFAGKLQVTWDRWHRAAAGAGVDDATLGREIGALTHPDDVLYGGAFGIAGFFAGRAWINGDGVINTLEYQEAIRDHQLREYLAAHHVDYVVFTRPATAEARIRVGVRSGLFGAVDTFEVDSADVRLRRPTLRAGGGEAMLARYRP